MTDRLVVFFDIGDTLADARFANGQLVGLDLYPFITDVLGRLRRRSEEPFPVELGLMSNTDGVPTADLQRVLTDSGLAALVDQRLCLFSSVEGLDKSETAFFDRGRARADLPATRCVFVGENAAERSVATSAGFRVSPHPLHALHLVETAI